MRLPRYLQHRARLDRLEPVFALVSVLGYYLLARAARRRRSVLLDLGALLYCCAAPACFVLLARSGDWADLGLAPTTPLLATALIGQAALCQRFWCCTASVVPRRASETASRWRVQF